VSDAFELAVIGWREWIALPELGVPALKVKVDTGARTSALHAVNVEEFFRRGARWVRFGILPHQQDLRTVVSAEAPLVEHRQVRSSNGHRERRPVIATPIVLAGQQWLIELTLTNRAVMGFRMLLGREAIQRRFQIDPARSYLGGGAPERSADGRRGGAHRQRSIPRGTP
jgi:hypothetical protein